jgi:hypothetical protein
MRANAISRGPQTRVGALAVVGHASLAATICIRDVDVHAPEHRATSEDKLVAPWRETDAVDRPARNGRALPGLDLDAEQRPPSVVEVPDCGDSP